MGSPSKMGVYEGHTGAIWAWNGLEYGIPTWVYHSCLQVYRKSCNLCKHKWYTQVGIPYSEHFSACIVSIRLQKAPYVPW